MSVKFRIGLTIDGEALLKIIGNMLPIEDVEVEELTPSKTALAERAFAVHKITRRAIAASKRKPKFTRPNTKTKLDRGINKIIVGALTERPMRAKELQPLVHEAGWSSNSVNSRLEALRLKGFVTPVGDGRWQMVKT